MYATYWLLNYQEGWLLLALNHWNLLGSRCNGSSWIKVPCAHSVHLTSVKARVLYAFLLYLKFFEMILECNFFLNVYFHFACLIVLKQSSISRRFKWSEWFGNASYSWPIRGLHLRTSAKPCFWWSPHIFATIFLKKKMLYHLNNLILIPWIQSFCDIIFFQKSSEQ